MRTLVTLACTECKRRNYTTKKNKQNNPDRIEFKKYCKWCNKHTLHRETRCWGFESLLACQLVSTSSPIEAACLAFRRLYFFNRLRGI